MGGLPNKAQLQVMAVSKCPGLELQTLWAPMQYEGPCRLSELASALGADYIQKLPLIHRSCNHKKKKKKTERNAIMMYSLRHSV